MKMKIRSLIPFLLLFSLSAFAQDRYMVFFKDKQGTPFQIDQPLDFLSPRAIARRAKHGLVLDSLDLPVSPQYVNGIKALGIETYFTTKWMNGVIVQMPEDRVPEVAALPYVKSVEFVAPGALLEQDTQSTGTAITVSDAAEIADPTRIQNEMIGIDQMHADGLFGEGVLVAVFDDGFANYNQIAAFESLQNGRLLYTKDFTTNANDVNNNFTHGTRVLSVMAASDGNFKGVLPAATYILSVTEAQGEYRIEEYNWLFAAEMADSAGVDIINTSLAYGIFDDPSMSYELDDMDGQTTVISKASQMAADKGIFLVNSAGNAGHSTWQKILAPADVEAVMSVGAVTSSGERAFFSSVGPNASGKIKPDLMAKGAGTAVIDADGQYRFQNGTSFSAPLIAGLAGGLLNKYPELTAPELFETLLASANLFNDPDSLYGHGIPNYLETDLLVAIEEAEWTEGVKVYPNPVTDNMLQLVVNSTMIQVPLSVDVIDTNGKLMLSKALPQGRSVYRFQLPELSNGLYFLRIKSSRGNKVKRLLVR
jgi:serine protease AprX